jgi:hypothetical protein
MVGPISLSNYPHENMVSKTGQRVATEFDIMGLLQNFLDGFYYSCIGPVQCLLYINLKLYCGFVVSCLRQRAASLSPKKIGFSGITDGQIITLTGFVRVLRCSLSVRIHHTHNSSTHHTSRTHNLSYIQLCYLKHF